MKKIKSRKAIYFIQHEYNPNKRTDRDNKLGYQLNVTFLNWVQNVAVNFMLPSKSHLTES